jgi:hypothetical protein
MSVGEGPVGPRNAATRARQINAVEVTGVRTVEGFGSVTATMNQHQGVSQSSSEGDVPRARA